MFLLHPSSSSTARRFIALWLTLCLALIPLGASYAQPAMDMGVGMDMSISCDQCSDAGAAGGDMPCEQRCASPVCISLGSSLSLMALTLRIERRDLPAQKLFLQARLRYQSPDSTRLIRPPIA